MGFFSKWRTHKAVCEQGVVDVSEHDGVRLLHLGSDTVQSAMRLSAPNRLELDYTRAMMGFLLFHPDPKKILMVGLGGGSLAKYVYHNLPETRTEVVEINPQVVAVARSHFHLPPMDERLSVEVGDGAEAVRNAACEFDVLMVDGYNDNSLAEELVSQSFFDDCAAALTSRGVLVVNLWGSDKRFDGFLKRIETSFEGLTLCMTTSIHSNIIVFGFKQSPGSPRWQELFERAKALESQYGLEFPQFVDALRGLNVYNEQRLLV
jgi:spermidine synthase